MRLGTSGYSAAHAKERERRPSGTLLQLFRIVQHWHIVV